MSYWGYVVAAYAVFVIVMLWDWLSPTLQIRQQLRAARLRAKRNASAGTGQRDAGDRDRDRAREERGRRSRDPA